MSLISLIVISFKLSTFVVDKNFIVEILQNCFAATDGLNSSYKLRFISQI